MATVIVLGGTAHAIHVFQVANVAKGLLLQAQTAEKANDTEKAQATYLQYLGYNPADSDALANYSLLVARDPKSTAPEFRARAIVALEKAVARDPVRVDTRKELAKLLHAQGRALIAREEFRQDGLRRVSEALDYVKSLVQEDPSDASLLEMRAGCYEDLGQFDEALKDYEKARATDSTLIDVYPRLALLLRLKLKQPDADRADAVMDARETRNGLIARNPKSGKAYLTRARYRRAFKLDGSKEDIAEALKLDPDDVDILLAAAEVAREGGDRSEERRLLERGLEKHSDVSEFYRTLASLEAREGKVDDAIKMLTQGAEALPKDIYIRWTLADVLIQSGLYEEASAEIQKLRDLGFLHELGDALEGQLLFRQRKWSEAAKVLSNAAPLLDARRGMVSDQAKLTYLLLAQCQEQLGNPDQQLDAYRKAAAIPTPNNPALDNQARAGLAMSYVALNRGDAAIEEFDKLAKAPNAPPIIQLGMVQQMIAKNRRLPQDKREWTSIAEAIDNAERSQPKAIEPKLLRVEMLVARDQLAAARELLDKLREEFPEVPSVWITTAIVANRQGRSEEIPRIFEEGAKKLGDVAEFRIAKASYWGAIGGDAGKAGLAEVGKDLDKYPKATQRRILGAIGFANIQLREYKTAADVWQGIAGQYPEDLEPRLVLFDLAVRQADEAGMREQIDVLHKVEGEGGTYWRYGEARLCVLEADRLLNSKNRQSKDKQGAAAVINKGRKLIVETMERRPNWARALLVLAEFDELDGQTQNALTNYLKAILDLGERDERAIIRSVQLLNRSRRYAEADQLLRKIQQERPLLGQLGKLAADSSTLNDDFARALDLAEKTVLATSVDPRDHLWLGQLRAVNGERAAQAGRKAEAEKFYTQAGQSFRRAIELAPTDPAGHIVLVRFLILSKQADALESALAMSDKVLSKGKAALVRAQALELSGQAEQAIGKYREALAEAPDEVLALRGLAELQLKRGNAKEAEETLRTMAALGPKSPEEAKLGKRVLAMLLGSTTDYRKSVQALQLLSDDDVAGSQPQSVEDRRAKARILARQPNRPQRRQAIALLEGINASQVPIPDDQYVLAQLYEADGDWAAAKSEYEKVLKADPKNNTVALTYARALIRRKDFDGARFWVKKLEDTAPRTPALLEVQSRLLAATNRGAEAASLARSIVDLQPNQAPGVAALLEEIGEISAAEAMFRQVANNPDKPTNPLLLAEFLGRHGHASEALDICDKAWATCPPNVVASVSVLVLYNSQADDSLCKRVIARLEPAIKDHPDEVEYQFGLANVYVLQRRYSEAEAIYRKTAEFAKDNASSLNNLAWLLSIQNSKGAEALKVANESIALAGPRPQILDTRALAYMVLNQADAAIKDLEDAVAVEPSAEIYVHLARAYWMANRFEDAGKAMKEASTLGLQIEKIHPLERDAYKKLLADLARRGEKF